MKKFFLDHKAQSNVMNMVVLIGVLVASGSIVIYLLDSIDGITPVESGAGAYASSTLTFTNLSKTGEYVNITNSTDVKHCFYFDADGGANEAGCSEVNVSGNLNSSTNSSVRFMWMVNNETGLNNSVTATNAVAGVVVITANALGTAYNGKATTETLNNGSFAATTFAGGVAENEGQQSITTARSSLFGTFETGYSFLPILIVSLIGVLAIGYIFGLMPGMGGGKGGGGL